MKVKSCLSTKTPNSIEKYLPKGLGVMSAISLMLFMSFAQPGYAGNAKNPSSSEVNFDSTSSVMAPEMVVTATKSGINVSDAPASVSVITSENIETKNVRRAEEALTGQAGVYIKGAGDHAPSDNSGTVVYMRGIPGLGRTAVLLDGQSLNDPFSGGVNWSGIFADELDKIEVVRGPFSSLYGGNAISGVINFITKAPTKSEIIANAGYGSNNLFSGTIVYRNKFDRIGLSLGYGHEQSNGYAGELTVKTATAGTGTTPATGWTPTTNTLGAQAYLVGDKGDRWWNKDNVEMKLFYDLTEYSKVSLRAAWNKHETGFDGFNSYLRDTTGNTVISGSVGITDGAAKKFTLSETDFLLGENGAENFKINLGYETRLGDELRIKADAGYLNTGYWYVSQLTGATSKSGPGKYVDIPNNRYYISLQATQPLFGNQLLTVGINANQDAVHKREYNLADWQNHGDRGTIRYSVDGKNTTYGFFAQDELYLLDNLTLYLGARYDTWATEGSDNQTIAPVSSHDFAKRSKSAFSPKSSVVYKPLESTSLRASVGSAFKGPSLSQLYSSITSLTSSSLSNPNLNPEKSTSWEIGVEHKFADLIVVQATYYESYLKDLIYYTTISTGITSASNAGKAAVKGVELEVRAPIIPEVTAFANATYNKSRITENTASPLTVGKWITNTPETMFNVGVEARMGAWTSFVTARYVGKLYTNDQNLDVVKGVYGSTDPYTIVNAKVIYDFMKGKSLSVAVDNLLDRTYYQNYLMPGRTFFSELKLNF